MILNCFLLKSIFKKLYADIKNIVLYTFLRKTLKIIITAVLSSITLMLENNLHFVISLTEKVASAGDGDRREKFVSTAETCLAENSQR